MKPPDRDIWDTSLGRLIRDSLLGMRPAPAARRLLLEEAALSTRRAVYARHPGWISASVAHSLRVRDRRTSRKQQYGHMLMVQNLRLAW